MIEYLAWAVLAVFVAVLGWIVLEAYHWYGGNR